MTLLNRLRGGGASRSREGVIATLSKLIDAATAIAGLSAETQRLMVEEVMPHEQVRSLLLHFTL
jgi:hypothetical protein